MFSLRKNERGIALLIVMLVTALLIALVFEFAYATRISLNSAVNFRDSQRAYFLALTGINAFKTNGQKLQESIPAGEWRPVPLLVEGDTQIMVKWEDESGKIKINDVKSANGQTLAVARGLFENVKRIDTTVLDRMTDPESDIAHMALLSDLHQYMSDEDYGKVAGNLTTMPTSTGSPLINVNTASSDVLQSLGIPAYDAETIIRDRQSKPYTDVSTTGPLGRLQNYTIKNLSVLTYLTPRSAGYYKVYAYATVGGYTKQVEAILNGSTVYYWKAL